MPTGDPPTYTQMLERIVGLQSQNGWVRPSEAVLKITADTSEFEAAMQRCLDMARELNAEVDKLKEKQRKVESND